MGFSAKDFASAEEFLASDRLCETSCVIADVQMPGIGGLELQKRLGTTGIAIPIVFITAYPDARIRAIALQAGALGFLTKPVCEGDLLTCIHRALGREDRTAMPDDP